VKQANTSGVINRYAGGIYKSHRRVFSGNHTFSGFDNGSSNILDVHDIIPLTVEGYLNPFKKSEFPPELSCYLINKGID
jgi:hypothetical protein